MSTFYPINNHTNSNISLGWCQTVCWFYIRSICRYGELCRYSHIWSHDQTYSAPNAESTGTTVDIISNINPGSSRRNWADAPVFVPANKPYKLLCHDENVGPFGGISWVEIVGGLYSVPVARDNICPYESPCPYGKYCSYRNHMELCEMCRNYVLHPTDKVQRKNHNRECLQQHEQAMELSFAIARSKDKICAICFEKVVQKSGHEKRFGILANCKHVYCLNCIRTWRQSKEFGHKVVRACPVCRVCSDYVCANAFWVETKEQKDKLLSDYHAALSGKDCKYFKKGNGKCPFGNRCFYKHALPIGDIVNVGLRKHARQNEMVDLLDVDGRDDSEYPEYYCQLM